MTPTRAVVGSALLVVAFGVYLVTTTKSPEVSVARIESQLHSRLEAHNGRAATQPPPPQWPIHLDPTADTAPSASASHFGRNGSVSRDQSVAMIPRAGGSAPRPTLARPMCADPTTGAKLNCDNVSACYPEGAWKPAVAARIAEKFGVDSVTLCAP